MTRFIATLLGLILCGLTTLALAEDGQIINVCYTGSNIGFLSPCPS
ncbi:MAG: hypothetical protein ABWK15_09325 [Dissulfuribacterales bacterium]